MCAPVIAKISTARQCSPVESLFFVFILKARTLNVNMISNMRHNVQTAYVAVTIRMKGVNTFLGKLGIIAKEIMWLKF